MKVFGGIYSNNIWRCEQSPTKSLLLLSLVFIGEEPVVKAIISWAATLCADRGWFPSCWTCEFSEIYIQKVGENCVQGLGINVDKSLVTLFLVDYARRPARSNWNQQCLQCRVDIGQIAIVSCEKVRSNVWLASLLRVIACRRPSTWKLIDLWEYYYSWRQVDSA